MDITFNTNKLYISLSSLVGILNTGKIFLFVFYFITLGTKPSFEFIENQLNDLFFYNYLYLKVICRNYAKGLTSAIGG